MTQRILFTCDAPDCDHEVDEEGEFRVLERTTFGRGAVNVERRHACSVACEAAVLRSMADAVNPTERGWYVLPGKHGFNGAGWFETHEAAEQGLERDVLGPFPTMHEARQARERVYPVLAPRALSDLLRLAGRHVPTAVVKTWSVANQHEAEAWAAFTLSDAQLGVRRAPPEPAHVREGAVIKLKPSSMYGKVRERPILCSRGCHRECDECAQKPGSPTLCANCLRTRRECATWWAKSHADHDTATPFVPVWRSASGIYTKIGEKTEIRPITEIHPIDALAELSQNKLAELRAKAMCFCPNLQCAGFQKIGPGECEKCGAGLVTSVVQVSDDPDQNDAPEPSRVPAAEPLATQSCAGDAEACPAASQKATTIPSVVRVSWKTEDGTYSCDVDVAKGASFNVADVVITVDPLPVKSSVAPTGPDQESAPTDERPPPSAVERTAGIRYSETTPEERAAVDRIKRAYCDLTRREKDGSHTDVIMDLTVAIVAEMRRAAQEAEKILVSVAEALDDAGAPADPSLFERVQWLTRRTIQAGRVHTLLDEAGFAPDVSLPGRVLDALTELLDGAGVAGQRRLKERVADLRDRVATRQGANERVRTAKKDVEEAKFSAEMKAERDALREQKLANDATIERLQTELRRQRDELLAELNEVRDDRERWVTVAGAADRAMKELRAKYDAALTSIDETTAWLKATRKETGAPPGPNTAEAVRSLRLERDTLRGENMRLAEDLTQLRNYRERVVAERNILIKDLCKLRDLIKLGEPIPVFLHCPACGAQHVDVPDPEKGWTDPPHRSHLCASCGCVWRAADVPTRGVAAPSTRGEDDTWPDPRGDGPGWYICCQTIGWFTNRARACARFKTSEISGPVDSALSARSFTPETDEMRDRIALDIEGGADLIHHSSRGEIPINVVRSWSRDEFLEAVTWAAYDFGEDCHLGVLFVRDVPSSPPAPKHVEEADRTQLAAYAAQAAKRGHKPC